MKLRGKRAALRVWVREILSFLGAWIGGALMIHTRDELRERCPRFSTKI
jgi:hypothetical protein